MVNAGIASLYYRRNCPKVIVHGRRGCLNASDVSPTTGNDVNNAFSQPSSKEEITFPDTPMERSHVNEKLRGLYLPAFLGGSRDLVVQFCRSRFMIFYLMVLSSSI